MLRKNNKRGNWVDIVSYIQFAMMFMILAGVMLAFYSNFNSNVQSMDNETMPSEAKLGAERYNSLLPKNFDYVFIGISVIFFGFSAWSARLIPSTPLFLLVAFIVSIFLMLGALVIENIWDRFSTESAISGAISAMTFVPFIFDNFRYFVLFYIIVVGVALLSKEG